jgi:hypothetical protein
MSFEERLLVELKADMIRRAEDEARAVRPRMARRRAGRLALAGVGLLGATAAVTVAAGLVGPQTPAYALTPNPDGTILVRIKELRDAAGLEADLRAHGVITDITYLPYNGRCAGPDGSSEWHSPGDGAAAGDDAAAGGGAGETPAVAAKGPDSFVISPAAFRPGDIVVLRFWENPDDGAYQLRWRTADKPVPPCEIVSG